MICYIIAITCTSFQQIVTCHGISIHKVFLTWFHYYGPYIST